MTDPQSPRDYHGALEYARGQWRHPSQDWEGFCQKFVRSSYAIPSLYSSAYLAWLGVEAADKHVGGNIDDAPVGAALFFKGDSPFGHIILAANPFADGDSGAWGTDMVRTGKVDKHERDAPVTAWGQRYLGWTQELNEYDLRVKTGKPPVPKQDKRYEGIRVAVEAMERARESAIKDKDVKDIEFFDDEIKRLKAKYDRLRHS